MSDWLRLMQKMGAARTAHTSSLIPHLHIADISTVGVPEAHRVDVGPPYISSGLALAPVIKGLPIVQYSSDHKRRIYRWLINRFATDLS